MKTVTATGRRKLLTGLIAAAVPTAALALLAQPQATGAADPCAASEVARTMGSVAKSMGDYLDAHPETNNVMTSVLQQQAGPQSFDALKAYFTANPKVAMDFQTIMQPLTGLSTQCKLRISLPQAMGLLQQAQGTGGLPSLPGGLPGGAPGGSPAGVAGPAPSVRTPGVPVAPAPGAQPHPKSVG
jgi:heme-binding protein